MAVRRTWLASALFLLAPALAGFAAEKDLYGDPLPEGATARLGTARMRTHGFTTPLLTPDGKSLYVAGPFGLYRYDPATGAKLGKVPGQSLGSIATFSGDGKRAATQAFDHLLVWDTASGKTVVKVPCRPAGGNGTASFSADGTVLAIGGLGDSEKKAPATALVWDLAAKKERAKIVVPQNQSAQVALAPDGKVLATWGSHYDPSAKPEDQDSSPARLVHFWDATTGKELSRFRVAGYAPAAVALGPTGAAAVSDSSTITLVDPKTGTAQHQLLGRSRMGGAVGFSPDGSVVAAASDDGAVLRWRTADGARLSTTEPVGPRIYAVRLLLTDNDKGIAWGTRGATTVVWEVPSGKPISPEGGHTNGVTAVAVAPDGKHVLTAAGADELFRWELATGKPVGEIGSKAMSAYFAGYGPRVVFSRDTALALIRDHSGAIGVYDLATRVQLYTIPVPNDGASHESFSPDGTKVVVTHTPRDPGKKAAARAIVYDAVSSRRLGAVELPGYAQVSAALAPDGKHLVTAGVKWAEKGDGPFVVAGWELATGKMKGELVEKSSFSAPHVVAAADSRSAAVVTAQGAVIAVDFLEGKRTRTFDMANRAPGAAPVFSADGKRLAIACQPSYGETPTAPVYIFDWESGRTKQTLTVPGQVPQALAFSPDGKRLVTGGSDTTALVWDVSK